MSNYTLSNFRALPVSSKEELSTMAFTDGDVLTRDEDMRVRLSNIDKGIALAKSKENKTTIIVKSLTGLHKLLTVVKSRDEHFVYTEDNLKIPVNIIYSVDFY